MISKKLIFLIAVFSLYLTQLGVDCGSSVTVFSGNAKEFKKRFKLVENKFTLVSFNDKGYALKACKELAENLDGLAEVVAVSCKDEANLCEDLKVDSNSYYLYPKKVKYTGDEKTPASILDFVIETGPTLHDIGNMESFYRELYQTLLYQNTAWLVSFCFNETDESQDASDVLNKDLNCFSPTALRKISMALNGKVKVAQLNCDSSQEICKIAKSKRSSPLVLYSYFPGLQALYSLKDGATTIEKIRDLIQQDEVVSSDLKEIIAVIPTFIEGQEKNDKFFDPRVMKTAEQVIEEKAAAKAAKKAAEEAADNRVDDVPAADATDKKQEL